MTPTVYIFLFFPKVDGPSALFMLFIQKSQLLYVVATTAYIWKTWMPWMFLKHPEKWSLVLVRSGRGGLLHQRRRHQQYLTLHHTSHYRVSLWSSYCFCSAVSDGPALHGLNQH